MKLDRYELIAGENLTTFEFTSEGPKGKIDKLIQFTETDRKGVYNLGFGDKDLLTGEIDDLSVSNNSDTEKVLATVVAAVYLFISKNPNASIFAEGSSKARNRLYRMGISKFLDEAKNNFEIFGQLDGQWREFQNEIDYNAFLVKRKN